MITSLAFAAVAFAIGFSTPVRAQSCLTGAEMREAIAERKVVAPADAMRSARAASPGDVIRLRLCRHSDDNLEYQVTIMRRDGKVRRVTVEAASGNVAAER